MQSNPRALAEQIWLAGVDAVRAEPLLRSQVRFIDQQICCPEFDLDVPQGGRLEVVGAGKAAAAMAAGLVASYGERQRFEAELTGWVNIPAGTERDAGPIHLHVGRPAGVNEPTEAAIEGTRRLLNRVAQLGTDDVCVVLISGGGSALMAAPLDGITLADKLDTIRCLSAGGANIEELNTVRKHLSAVKGGGLARACNAGRLLTIVISDVLGDPLDLIASGPTIPDPSSREDAIQVLRQFDPQRRLPESIYRLLEKEDATGDRNADYPPICETIILANNAMAVDEAGIVAEQLGFQHAMHAAGKSEGNAEAVGKHLAEMALAMLREEGPNCLITGGEPTVALVDSEIRGKGGRNQQLVLAAMQRLSAEDVSDSQRQRIAILSGGTDGEDGPTDAAGAVLDAGVWERLALPENRDLVIGDYLHRNDAYSFFTRLNGLIKTGPTHTNVCDLRVVVVDR